MKAVLIAAALALASTAATAQSGSMKGMDMQGDKGVGDKGVSKAQSGAKHIAKGTVKSVDAQAATVTLDHEPVKSLNWPRMKMAFKVQDKALLEKLGAGKKVEVEFEQRGKDYVITGAK